MGVTLGYTKPMEEIIAQYTALWTAYYTRTPFGGSCIKTAAAYATMDCLNAAKRGNWTEADCLPDIEYWKSKIETNTEA